MNSVFKDMTVAAISRTETFANPNGTISPGAVALGSLIASLLVFVLLLLFGQYLWNNALCPLVSVVKPAKSIFQILGVAILIALLSPA
jgi:polyferredoxin